MNRYYYAASIPDFMSESDESVLGKMAGAAEFDVRQTQRDAWLAQLDILRTCLTGLEGEVAFEYSVPRMGSRIDAVVISGDVVFVIEFKVGAESFDRAGIDQVYDYALDLHHFHEPSHACQLVPVLVATKAHGVVIHAPNDQATLVHFPVSSTVEGLADVLRGRLRHSYEGQIDASAWLAGRYNPTPTIVEAATALYRGHSVSEISRSDAGGQSLQRTSDAVPRIIEEARDKSLKAVCFVTGVPGAGKTLVGLNIANQHTDADAELYSVFLSGNGPLVNVLREALARDEVARQLAEGKKIRKGDARSKVKQFIQNVHHFRDDCLRDSRPPIEHVALFDEAQRAWDLNETASFMARKKNLPNFAMSEPEFLISCLNRHEDWATVVCLVGGGQEINRGEGGISEWITALRSFSDWQVHMSSNLHDAEFDPGDVLRELEQKGRVFRDSDLHLYASMRSFRAESVSSLVRALLEIQMDEAKLVYSACADRYPIVLTRNLSVAKSWVRDKARGSERYGLVVSSSAERLRPLAVHVKAPMDPVHWFLDKKDDVRSSYYLEDVATEFHIQGLELDWACVTWDADFRYSSAGWQNFNFVGSKWNRVNQPDRQRYQKNAYRVLLTRARQGMAIVVPEGDTEDPTRLPRFYDGTFEYLREVGFPVI